MYRNLILLILLCVLNGTVFSQKSIGYTSDNRNFKLGVRSVPEKCSAVYPVSDPNFFPIAAWYQSGSNAQAYKNAGFNMYVVPDVLTETRYNYLKAAGMKMIYMQNSFGLSHMDDPDIYAWHIGTDEPDNAQWNEVTQTYDSCINPRIMINTYNQIKANDPSRPVYLNLGPGVADLNWSGRGKCRNNLDTYRESTNGYLKGGDIVSFDIYPVNGAYYTSKDKLWYVPKGVDSLKVWTSNSKPVWTWIESTKISSSSSTGTPTPTHVRAEVWMALIHGVTGIGYYCHVNNPFDEAGLLHNATMLSAVTAINNQITSLAPVLNSPSTSGYATVTSSNGAVPIDILTKNYDDASYIFAVTMRPGATVGTFTVTSGNVVEVIGEDRIIPVVNGKFTDDFSTYAVHLYKVKTTTGVDDIYNVNNWDLLNNYPNPFDKDVTVSYKVPVSGLVSLKVFDFTGKEVANLLNENKILGEYSYNWKVASLSSGMYFLKITIQSSDTAMPIVSIRKMILEK
ncbi:MAG: T9SS type A sorting domain-containing protein [Paludibacter sp.]|nr:T9SS type A sorting domain-containing protein [Paludibacter sp.]